MNNFVEEGYCSSLGILRSLSMLVTLLKCEKPAMMNLADCLCSRLNVSFGVRGPDRVKLVIS